MGNIVVLTGPQAIGKTRKSGSLREALGCSMIADNWDGKTDHKISALYITNSDSFEAPEGARVIRASSAADLDDLIAKAEPNPIQAIPHTNIPELAEGERHLGAFSDLCGNLQHVILLPGDNDFAEWSAQMNWAKSIGGDLPTRSELLKAYETMPEEFQKTGYWSNTTHRTESGWAWCQSFDRGHQYGTHKYYELRGRAVRRLPIQ